MNLLFGKVALPILGVVVAAVTALTGVLGSTPAPQVMSGRVPTGSIVINWAGQGRIEAAKPKLASTRYEGRFVIFSLGGGSHPILPADAPLFDPACVALHGVGPGCAYLVAVRDGAVQDGFLTGDSSANYTGQEIGWSVPGTQTQIYFNAHPDGTRSFADRSSFTSGTLVATYAAKESFELDPVAGTFYTRVSYRALSAQTFTLDGKQINFEQLAPYMTEAAVGHNPAPLATPEQIPLDVPVFHDKGAGVFPNLFSVSGSVVAAG